MIMATPYIPVKKYESLSDISNILWSGFSGDPLMGSHTLKEESINQKSNLLAICFEKYKSLSKDEMRLLNLDFNIKALKNEINSTVKYFEHLNIIEGFDSWYMQNRNRYTTQCGVSACRNLFEFIYPFLFVTDYALLSRLEGRYNRSDYLEHVKKLYTSAFKIPSSNHWNTYQRGSEKFGYLMNKNLLKYYLILDKITIPLSVLGLIFTFFKHNPFDVNIFSSIIGGVIGYLIIYIIRFLFFKVRKVEGMGLGDAKLFLVVGIWLGVESIYLILASSAITGAIVGSLIIYLYKKDKNFQIPYGCFIVIASALYPYLGSVFYNLI